MPFGEGVPSGDAPAGGAEVVLAWVESPFQLLGALESFASGHLGERLDVLPRRGVEPLAATVSRLRELGLPAGVRILAPAPAPRRHRGRLAIGDAFSGEVHRLLMFSSLSRLTIMDDGRSTRRVMDALVLPDVALVRPHITPSPARRALAALALRRIRRLAARGRLEVITALDLPDDVLGAAQARGIRMRRHSFGWLRALPDEGLPAHDTVVLGTSLVANDLIAADPYLEWVRAIARQGPVTYRAHRREDARTLEPLSHCPQLVVESGHVPVEVSLRGMTARQRVLTLPTTAVSTLRLIAPLAQIQEFAVPAHWWLPDVPQAARRHLVPDDGHPSEVPRITR